MIALLHWIVSKGWVEAIRSPTFPTPLRADAGWDKYQRDMFGLTVIWPPMRH
jgi:hypothetical protein